MNVPSNWVFYQRPGTVVPEGHEQLIAPLLANEHVDVIGGPVIGSSKLSVARRALSIAISSPLCSGINFPRYRSFGKAMIQSDFSKLTYDNLWIRKELVGQDLKGRNVFYHPYLRIYDHEGRLLNEFVNGEGSIVAVVFILLHALIFFSLPLFIELAKIYWISILFVSVGLSLKANKVWIFPLVALYHYIVPICSGIGFIKRKMT
jgi:hypothetical protein